MLLSFSQARGGGEVAGSRRCYASEALLPSPSGEYAGSLAKALELA
jgi:hypothetical protein